MHCLQLPGGSTRRSGCNRRNFGCCCSKPRGYSLAHVLVRARNRCKRTTRVICPYVPLTAACRENPATRHVASGTQNRKKTYSYLAIFLAIFGNIGQISKDYRNYNPLYIGQYLGHIWATCPKPVMPHRIPVLRSNGLGLEGMACQEGCDGRLE